MMLTQNSLFARKSNIYIKGQIEFLVYNSDIEFIQENTNFIDSLFTCASNSLSELELNLSYKLNEPIRLVIFSSIAEYEKHSQLKHSKYAGILLNGNAYDIQYQIRFNIAKHLITEYLTGISIRERIEKSRAERIPNWLINGFIQYFAQGITYHDFELFKRWSKDGKFRNINFISSEFEDVFGTVVWYLFEKEKGRSIDGAFWMLIKNANSFEKSFEYHFNERFNKWLRNKIQEIVTHRPSVRQSDFQTNNFNKSYYNLNVLPVKKADTVQIFGILSKKNCSQFVKFSNLNRKAELLEKLPQVSFNKHLIFTQPTMANSDYSNESLYLMIWKNNQWALYNHNTLKFIPKNQQGIFKILHCSENSIYISHEILDHTELLEFNLTDNSVKTIYQNSGDKLISCFKDEFVDSLFYTIETIRNWNGDIKRSIVKQLNYINPSDSKIIWESNSSRWVDNVADFIQESNNHFSFIHSKETKIEIIHLFESDKSQINQKSIPTKGDFYRQSRIRGFEKQLLEYFFDAASLHINFSYSNEQIFDFDTLKQKYYSFDSTIIEPNEKSPKSSYSYNSLFLSEFESLNLNNIINNSINSEHEIIKTKTTKNWFYPSNSSFYLSNKDFAVGYSRKIPVTELYNSIFTLFYGGTFYNNYGNEKLTIDLFSNFNRRRVGINLNYNKLKNNHLNEFQFFYRQRQFTTNLNNNAREQTIFLAHGYYLRNKKYRSLHYFFKTKSQTLSNIPLNFNTELSSNSIKFTQLLESEIGININSNHSKYQNNKVKYLIDLHLQNGIFQKRLVSGFKLNTESRFHSPNFEIVTKFSGKYSFTEVNHLYLIGGSNGWINNQAFTNAISGKLNSNYQGLIYHGGFVRGTPSGIRIGNSYVSAQNELHYKPLKTIKSYVSSSRFWKNLTVYGFFDIGTAFIGGNTNHYNNPYNTIYIDLPNYFLTAGANRNPWVRSYGYGIQFCLLETDFRLEFPKSIVGDEPRKNSILISIGKNF